MGADEVAMRIDVRNTQLRQNVPSLRGLPTPDHNSVVNLTLMRLRLPVDRQAKLSLPRWLERFP